MKKEIKNNEVMNAVENTEVKNIEIEPIMDEGQMKQYVEENMHIVPRNQTQKFNALSLDKQVSKISFYLDMKKMREEAKVKNSVINRVKEVFEKRHANIDDAKQVLNFAQEFIDNYRMMQIAELDKQIAELEAMKEAL